MTPGRAYPSIQSFFEKEIPNPGEKAEAAETEFIKQGDGFTEEELADATDPLNRKWNPEREYEETNITELVPGPRAVTFVGRVVNMRTSFGRNPKEPKAAGWHYVLLKDNTAAISIKLYFSHTQYPLKLGQLLTIWTVFISDSAKAGSTAISGVINYANLYPGRVSSDHIMIHTTASTALLCRTPLDYRKGTPLLGLMTLETFLGSGHDGVVGARLLVCVKSIGARKRITVRGSGRECELADLWLFDHTGEVKWTVWNDAIDSAKGWLPGKTILLLSEPGYRVGYAGSGRGSLGLLPSTMVDVDPDFPDADWLRKYAAGLIKQESVAMEFPEGVWDVEAAEYGVNVVLLTLAEIDEMVRSDPRQIFTCHINVTIMEMALVRLQRQQMLLCAECCGVPVYATELTVPCPNCSKQLRLLLNPKIVGRLLDETGCIATGKLVWSERAWEQLLGRSVREVAEMTTDETRWLEQRILFTRMHLVVGWEEGVGRLAVLGMRA